MDIVVAHPFHTRLGGQVLFQCAAGDVRVIHIEGVGALRPAEIAVGLLDPHALIQLLDDGKAASAHGVVEDHFQVNGEVLVVVGVKVAAVDEAVFAFVESARIHHFGPAVIRRGVLLVFQRGLAVGEAPIIGVLDLFHVGAVGQQRVVADRLAVFPDGPGGFEKFRVHNLLQADVTAYPEFVGKDGGLVVGQAELPALHDAGHAFADAAALVPGLAGVPGAVGGPVGAAVGAGAVIAQRAIVGDLVVPHREAGGQLDVPFGAELGAVQAVVLAVAGAVFQGDAHGGDLGEVKFCIADQGIQRDAHQRPGVGQEEVGFLHIAEGAGGAEDGGAGLVLHLDVQVAAAVVLGGVVEFQFQEGVFLAACWAQVDGATWRAEGQPGVVGVGVIRVGRRVGFPACGLGDFQVAAVIGLDYGGAAGVLVRRFEGPAGPAGGGVEGLAFGLDIAGGVFHVQRDARGGHGLQFDLEAAEVFHRVGKE